MDSRRTALGLLALGWLASATGASDPDVAAPAAGSRPAPVHRELRYRLSAAIRPLLFWIGDKDVGGARIVWRRGADGRRGYEFLIGSDPARTPRRINRWGWVREDLGPGGATQIGLMRRTDEESIEQAQAEVGFEGAYVFKINRTSIAGGEARAENTVWLVDDDYTYYDLGELLRLVSGPPQAPPKVNEATLPAGTHPGFLFAVAEMVDLAVAAANRIPQELPRGITTHFNFNAVVYRLRLRKTTWEESKQYGDRRYERLVRLELESYNPQRDSSERFSLACGTAGEWQGVPVYVKYQPKWWFKAEGVIDESQAFDRRNARSDATPGVPAPGGSHAERP